MAESIDTLINQTHSGEDASLRREAVIKLGYREGKRIYTALLASLRDANRSVQHASVISLGRFGNPEAVDELSKAYILQSLDPNIRWAALAAIGRLGDFHVIDTLIQRVDDPEWIVRNQAATEIKYKIQEIIEIGNKQYLRQLIRLLSLENREIVDLALAGLITMGNEATDLLFETLGNPSPLMRGHAALALGRIGYKPAVPRLIDLLEDPDWQVRETAVNGLGLIQDATAIIPLVSCLSDTVPAVQNQATEALAGFGSLAVDHLLDALAHEKDKFTLRQIIHCLGLIGNERAIGALAAQLRSSYFVVRRTAVTALVRFGEAVIPTLVPLLAYNETDITDLMEQARKGSDPGEQMRAVQALGGLEDHRARDVLKKLEEKASPEVREEVVSALYRIGCAAWGRIGALIVLSHVGDESLARNFIYSLGDDSGNVRLEAVRALARVGGDKAVQALRKEVVADRDPYIRSESMRLLRSIGTGKRGVIETARQALADKDRTVRSQAARLLGNFQDNRSIGPLLEVTADSHWSVRQSAEMALINFGSTAVSHCIHALSSKSWTTRFRAARLLGEIGDTRAIPPLKLLIQNKGERKTVREVAEESLKKLNKSAAA